MMIRKFKKKFYALVFWQTGIGEVFNKIHDYFIFKKYSFKENKFKDKDNLEAYLTKQYHIIEKGLALPKPKRNFGKQKIEKLVSNAFIYYEKYGGNRVLNNIKKVLNSYLEKNDNLEKNDRELYELIKKFSETNINLGNAGVKNVFKNEVEDATNINFYEFMKTRVSVRNFSEEEVSDEKIFEAIRIAKMTPSVCNRQSWRVHYYNKYKTKEKMLSFQNGNSGFTHSINKLLIITTDTKYFTKLEGNQVFIDGGMFAMSLVLALHSLGLGTCCLNTCLPYPDEIRIKKEGNIPNSQRLIMMVGVGNLKESFKVAISDRVPLDKIIDY